MSYQIIDSEKKWSEETLPKGKIHKVIIRSSEGFLDRKYEQGNVNLQSTENEGEVILMFNNGVRNIELSRKKEMKFFKDFPPEIRSAIYRDPLQGLKNIVGIDLKRELVFEPENESDNERLEVGENPADDCLIWSLS